MIKTAEFGEIIQFVIARTIFGRALYYTAAYMVDGLLIDTGTDHCKHEFTDLCAALNVGGVVNTHSHEDHIGANGLLQDKYGLEIWAHPKALPVLADPRREQPLKPYQRIMFGMPEPSRGTKIGESVRTPEHEFLVINTPGHCPDHICLYEPDKGWLFTGDSFVGGEDRILRADYNICGVLDSLKSMLRLKPKIMFTASGSIRENAAGDLENKIRYLEETGRRAWELHQRGLSYAKIRDTILGRELPIRYVTQGHFSGINLIRSFIEDRTSYQEA